MWNFIRRSAGAFLAGAVLCSLMPCAGAQGGRDVRSPAVAGQFYPSNPAHLKQAIQQYLRDAVATRVRQPVALVVPHAGYIYAGQIMADGYRQVQDLEPEVVVILGANHTEAGFQGISIWARGAYRTPLGDAAIDDGTAAALLAADAACNSEQRAHLREHSVEVQVPFVQTVFPRARIVPVVVGTPDHARCIRFGEALAAVLKGKRALVIASSDLAHFPAYEDARSVDRETLESMTRLDAGAFSARLQVLMGRGTRNLDTCACGEAPIMAAMTAAKALGAARGVIVSYGNSGDALVGDKSRVVGYGSVIMASDGESPPALWDAKPLPPANAPLDASDKKALLSFARNTIRSYLDSETVPLGRNLPSRLQVPQGAFVTLKKHGELRGCIGHMASDTALGQTVGAMALEAAFGDPRFGPLQLSEFKDIEIEISVLMPMKPVAKASEIKVGRDGVVLRKGERSAVFLPQVAGEQGWDCDEMLENLCLKAGLPEGCWKQGSQLFVFQAEVFGERQPQ